MSNRMLWENKLYEHDIKRTGNITLNKKQLEQLITKVEKVYEEYVECVAFLYKPKFINVFYSEEVQEGINHYFKEAKECMKIRGNESMFMIDNFLYSLLEDVNQNRDLIKKLLTDVEQEINKLLYDLKHYNSKIDTLRQLFNITWHIQNIAFLITLTESYYSKRNLSELFDYMLTIVDDCAEHSKILLNKYCSLGKRSGNK